MDNQPLTNNPIPSSVRWWAFWSWSPWRLWGALAVALPILYVELLVPFEVWGRVVAPPPGAVTEAFLFLWTPVIWAYNESPTVSRFYDYQFQMGEAAARCTAEMCFPGFQCRPRPLRSL